MKNKQIAQAFRHNLGENALNARQTTGLLIGLIPAIEANFYVNSLETGAKEGYLSAALTGYPGIKNEASVTEMLRFLHDEGDRASYAILLPDLTANYKKKKLEEVIRSRFWGIESFVQKCSNLQCFIKQTNTKKVMPIDAEDLKKGLIGWDMARLVHLTRIAHDSGIIDREEAWKYIEAATDICASTFSNWEEVGKSYLIGKAMTMTEKKDRQQAVENYLSAIQDEESLWNKYPL